MSKQDMSGVRTAQDLERKYDLGSIGQLKKNYELQKNSLTKVENELNEFAKSTTKDIEELKNQVDGNITTWFSSGIPTIENYPANEWITDNDKNNHLGDLYYDNDTGKAYRFTKQDDDFFWIEITDTDATEALALASKAQDTADSKRRVFLITPYVPYDEGDLWLNNGELYVCNKSKTTEEMYAANDFEKATKYTDDTNLNNFVNVTYSEAMKNLTNQIDSKITTWYYLGAPTLDNEPANVWTTVEEKMKHTGDLYYDQDTGYAYRFSLEEDIYSWEKITDKDVIESLAIANAAKDTADKKRQVFVDEPIPPYDIGDLWIRDEEIYRCQTSRPTGETFEDNDWIKATKYTDDTVANQVGNKLTILSGTVTEIRQDVDELNTTMTNTTKLVDEQGNTIGTLQEKQSETSQTVDSISTKVSSVENGLLETNSNLSTLTGTVDTLNKDIQGVSADFEDFKDNEYVQGIDNLQKQIDGAIQFWNGAEIPTVSNYPANEWTTENDKINHQADIYTVVQDVEGEMKQGKSYRFDKVGGVWQWIELTDNELSAVQAIAQEALNKSNTNATDISSLKSSVSTLEQTDNSIKASVETINNQIIPTSQATGSYIHIEDSADAPLINLEIEGKSEQETRDGTNKFNATLIPSSTGIVVNFDGSEILMPVVTSGNGITYTGLKLSELAPDLKVGDTVYLNFDRTTNDYNLYIYLEYSSYSLLWYRKTSQVITQDMLNSYVALYANRYINGETIQITISNFRMVLGESDIEWEPYGTSPSPNYPSEIKSVGYENLFDTTKGTNGYINDSGSIVARGTQFASDYIKCDSEENYTISVAEVFNNIGVAYFDKDKNIILPRYDNSNKSTVYLTIPHNVFYFRTWFNFDGSVLLDSNIMSETYKAQIVKSKKVHNYIPHGKYGIEVEIVGKNLFDKGKLEQNGISTTGEEIDNAYIVRTDFIKVLNNVDYILSFDFNSTIGYDVRVFQYDSNKKFLKFDYTNTTKLNFKTETNAAYIRLSFYTDRQITPITYLNHFSNIQLEQNKTSTNYEEYKSTKIQFVLDEPLRSLPDGTKDVSYIQNGKIYLERHIIDLTLNGTENMLAGQYGTNAYKITPALMPNNDRANCEVMSNTFLGVSHADRANYKSNYIYVDGRDLYFRNTDFDSIDDFRTYLSENNVKVQYKLATILVKTEELGEIEIPSTLKGVSNITTTDELEPIINLEYVRDTTLSSYVEGQIQNERVIREENIAQLIIEDNQIKESVQTVSGSVDGLNTTVNSATETLTSQGRLLEIVSTNIDKSTGEVREVTTTTGITLNAKGMTISDDSGFKGEHTPQGTFYKDGETVTGQYTKDGSKQKDLELFGTYSYGKENIDDTPMFIAQLYKDENGEECFGHFYNGGGY